MIVGIIGLGYVGLTLGVVAASRGIEVYGSEINPVIKNALRNNKAHFFEKGLNDLILEHNNKNFHVVDSFPKDVKFDAFILTVGTPLIGHDVKRPNFDYILSALKSLTGIYDGSQMIILRSTVSVGTTRNIVLPQLSAMCGKPKDDILVGMCPERTIEGKALVELTTLPQIISGNNAESIEIAKDLFLRITPDVVEAECIEEAELAKLYCNTYRDITFALGNAFCLAAQQFGVDGVKAIETANMRYPRSNIAKPGFVAGPCLEKDAYILLNNMTGCCSKDFIYSARVLNESLEYAVCDYVKRKVGKPGQNNTLTLSGMAFKGRPATSDLRGSSSVYIAQKLAEMGYRLNLHDFVALPQDMHALNLGKCYLADALFDACKNSSMLLVLNNHEYYSQLPYDASLSGKTVLDAWNVCDNWHKYPDIKIDTIGTINIINKEN